MKKNLFLLFALIVSQSLFAVSLPSIIEIEDKLSGYKEMKWNKGDIIADGSTINGKKDGLWRYYYKEQDISRKIYEGTYKSDQNIVPEFTAVGNLYQTRNFGINMTHCTTTPLIP